MDHTGLPQTSIMESSAARVRDHGAVGALGDSQPVDRVTGRCSERIVQLLAGGIGCELDGLRKLPNWFSCAMISNSLLQDCIRENDLAQSKARGCQELWIDAYPVAQR